MYESPRDSQLWAAKDCSSGQPLLGCGRCLDRTLCGGLHVPNQSGGAYDCLSMCCGNKEDCDLVCPNAPARYLQRLEEVDGLDLLTIPVAPAAPMPSLPNLIPLHQGNFSGRQPLRDLAVVAVPLSMAVKTVGQVTRAKTPKELRHAFGVAPLRGWVVSGVEKDSRIERLWKVGDPLKLYECLKRSGVVFATTPNFSNYINAPRHDNLHSMKRIALTWYEMMLAGLPAALHINGRTDHDFVRWGEFARKQGNLQAVAFEFLTGAESHEDGERYVRRLQLFVKRAGRQDLVLVLRGGLQWSAQLREFFADIVSIDSDVYFKTVHRQRISFKSNGRPDYRLQKTNSPAAVRALYAQNWAAKLAVHAGQVRPSAQQELDLSPRMTPREQEGDNKPAQLDLFTQNPISSSTGSSL